MAFIGPAIASGITWLGGDTAAALAARVALQIGLAYVAQKYEARKVDSDPRTTRDVMVRSAVQPRAIILGKAFVAGVVAYSNARPIPGSHDNYELYLQIIHAGHKCADVEAFVFDDWLIPSGDINWTIGSPNRGYVTGGHWGVGIGVYLGNPIYAVQLEKHLNGERSPMLEAAGFSGDITTSHKMTGNCTTVYCFRAGSASESLFANGPPTTIRALIKGALVYDPRKDTTNGGSGAHRLADETTWEWSDNPILCCCYYLLKIMGVLSTRIDWPNIITQADVCDVLVPIPPAASPTVYEKRYTCNGMLTTGSSDQNNLSSILSSCLGTLSLEGGKFKPRAGGYITPDVSLTVDDIIGDVGITTSPSRSDRYNMVTGTYYTSQDTAQQVDFIPVTDSSFLSRDNGIEIRKTIDLPMTNSEYMCQRIARKLLNQSDNMITVTLPLRWTGLQLTPGTYVQLTYPELSWTNKVFRVAGFTLGTGDAPINVVMQEDSSTAWADPTVGQYSVRTTAGTINQAVRDVPPVTGATATAGPLYNLLEWVTPVMADSWDFIRIYASNSSAWSGAAVIAEVTTSSYVHAAEFDAAGATIKKWYWFVAVKSSVESLRDPNTDTSTISATPDGYPSSSNILPSWVSDFESIQRSDITLLESSITQKIEVDTSKAYIGSKSIKITGDVGNGGNWGVTLAAPQAPFDINSTGNTYFPVLFFKPNRRWLLIAAIYPGSADSVGANVQYAARLSTGANTTVATSANNTTMTNGQWNIVAFEIDATASSVIIGYVHIFAHNAATRSTAPYCWIDALQIKDVTDTPSITATNFTHDFTPGSGSPAGLIRTRTESSDRTISSYTIAAPSTGSATLWPWTLEPASKFLIEGSFSYTSGATPDIKWGINYSGAVSAVGTVVGVDAAGTAINSVVTDMTSTIINQGGGGTGHLDFKCTLVSHATSTNDAGFMWAQDTSNGTNTVLKAGSWMRVTKIG